MRGIGLKIGVITVCYNEIDSIDNTLHSIQSQTYEHVHILIVDGGSTDGTLDAIAKRSDRNTALISGKDNGIFDAMNIGLNKLDADWYVFMNAGDSFTSNIIIEKVVLAINAAGDDRLGVVYGDYCSVTVVRKAYRPNMLKCGLILTCHQSMFFKASDIRYDVSMPLYADFEYLCQYESQYKLLHLDLVMSNFSPGGVSEPPTWQKRSDKFRAVHRHYGVYGLVLTTLCSMYNFCVKLCIEK